MTKKQEERLRVICLIGSILFYGMSSFLLGESIIEKEKNQTVIQIKALTDQIVYKNPQEENRGFLVASKSGKKYYFPWCSGINRIKEENRIYFADEALAQQNGLTLSKTCD